VTPLNRAARRRAARLGDFALGTAQLVGRRGLDALIRTRPQIGRMRDRWSAGMRCAACDGAIADKPAAWVVVDHAGLVMIAGVCCVCAARPDALRAVLDDLGPALGGPLRELDPASLRADGGRA
jgi:hypothetical protein